MNEKRFSPAVFLLTALAILCAAWILLTTANMARLAWVPVPLIDDWDRWITYLTDSRLEWFWHEHVDHRLVLPKVLFEVDHFLFAGRGWFLLVCSFCLQGITGFMLWRFAARIGQQERNERVMQAAVIIACLFSAQQWVNFVWPFQVQFPMVYCAATAAMFALYKASQHDPPGGPLWFVGCVAAAVAANYSMANGVLLWPVLLVAAWWLRMNQRRLIAMAVTAIVCGVPYFYNWHKSSMPGSFSTGEHWLRIVAFWLVHLGSPASTVALWFNGDTSLVIGGIVGSVVAATVLAWLVTMWRHPSRMDAARTVLVFYCLYLLITSATMAYGRANEVIMEAYTPRYHTPSYILWLCVLLVAWPWLRSIHRAALYGALCAALLVGIVIHQRATLIGVRGWMPKIMLGEAALVDNVVDKPSWEYVYHTPAIATGARDYLRNNHLSLFAEEWTHWPGIPLERRFFIDRNPNACQGQVDEAVMSPTAASPSWQLSGWAWDVKAERAPHFIVLADDAGQVAGVALAGFPQPSDLAALNSQYLGSPWIGFVTGQPRAITAYLVEADERSLCALGKRNLPTRGREAALTELGPPLPEANPEITGGWTPDGYYKGAGGPGALAVGGKVYGSFPDANTGSIRMGPFTLDGHTDIAIPLVSGPDNHNLSIVVRDAATKEVLAKMSPPPVRVAWWAWRPDLPQGKEISIEVIAEDNGAVWGEWLAVSWPHALKTP